MTALTCERCLTDHAAAIPDAHVIGCPTCSHNHGEHHNGHCLGCKGPCQPTGRKVVRVAIYLPRGGR